MVGYIKGCDWVFTAKKGPSTDYHREMNAQSFEAWFQEQLIPALLASTLIVMDNASYHRYSIYVMSATIMHPLNYT